MSLLHSLLAFATAGPAAAFSAVAAAADAAAAAAAAPLPPVTLTDMPDEILLRIFHYLRHADPVRTVRGTPRHRYLFLNKRLYAVLRPSWYKHLELRFDQQNAADRSLISKLLWAADVHLFVKSAKVTLSNSELEQEAVAISVFANLRRLEVSIQPASNVNNVFTPPANHDEVLSGIPSRFPLLTEFRSGLNTITDDDFWEHFQQYPLPPRLELFEVRLYGGWPMSRPLPRFPRLDVLVFQTEEPPPQVGLHWRVLTHLNVKAALPDAWTTWLLRSLESSVQNGQALALQELDLPAMVYSHAAEAFGTSIDFAEEVLDLLRDSRIRRLKLRFGVVPCRGFGAALLERLTSLTLDFECNILGTLFVDVVSSLVMNAPNLTHLTVDAPDLECVHEHEARARIRLSEWDLARRHGPIRDLILLAQDTRILNFRTWKVRGTDCAWVHWTRSKPTEPFAREIWSSYPAFD
ncbi:hypothetical protein JCM3774_001214 [Rhodotorula dairenensis]